MLATVPAPEPSVATIKTIACADPAAPKISNNTASRAAAKEKHRSAQETIKPDFIV
jgi:hypothetical protein